MFFMGKVSHETLFFIGFVVVRGFDFASFCRDWGTAPGGSGRFAPPVPEDVLRAHMPRGKKGRFRLDRDKKRVVLRTHLESIACWSPKKSTRCASFFSLTWCDSGMIAMGRTAARVAHRARFRRDCATRLMVTRGGVARGVRGVRLRLTSARRGGVPTAARASNLSDLSLF